MKSQNKVTKLLLSATLMLSIMLIASPSYADDTGLKSPTVYSTGETTVNPPTDPEQALVDDVATGATNDDDCALFRTNNPGGGGGVADSEIYNGFTFGIPSGATIDGIEVIVSGYRTGSDNGQNATTGALFKVRLNDGSDWTEFQSTPTLTFVDAEYTLGASDDTWDGTWNADTINTDLKLEIIPDGPYLSGEQWKLDSISVKVYYTVTNDDEGLSHGYWKNHLGDWPATDYSPTDTLGEIFDLPASIDLGSSTLLEALKFQGGDTLTEKAQILFIQAVAALLNASHPNINYPLTPAQVITYVNAALDSGDEDIILELKDELDGYNNIGGDINT